jgi:hypothetical protein
MRELQYEYHNVQENKQLYPSMLCPHSHPAILCRVSPDVGILLDNTNPLCSSGLGVGRIFPLLSSGKKTV